MKIASKCNSRNINGGRAKYDLGILLLFPPQSFRSCSGDGCHRSGDGWLKKMTSHNFRNSLETLETLEISQTDHVKFEVIKISFQSERGHLRGLSSAHSAARKEPALFLIKSLYRGPASIPLLVSICCCLWRLSTCSRCCCLRREYKPLYSTEE